MKNGLGLVLFIALIISFAAPAGAYQYINSGTDNCQSCHVTKFANGTAWHDAHQTYTSCLSCHAGHPRLRGTNGNLCLQRMPRQFALLMGYKTPRPPQSTCLQCHVQCNSQPAGVNLSLADIALPCSDFGTPADMPLTLTTEGAAIAAVSADIPFDASYFEFVDATIGPAGSAANKGVEYNLLSPGVVRIGVFSNGNTTCHQRRRSRHYPFHPEE